MNNINTLPRRDFIKKSTLLGSGLTLAFFLPGFAKKELINEHADSVFAPNAFLRIGTDDKIEIILSKVEMGQGIWTTLPILLAEELDCDLKKINISHSPADKAYTHTFFPMQGTIGSTSTVSEFDRYRQAGATARAMLILAAAKRFGVRAEDCRTENGWVISGNHKSSYGQLATEAATIPVPQVTLKEAKDWKYIGKSQKRFDTPSKVNGQAKFGMDIQFPGLLTALVAHPPVYRGKVKSFDATKTKAIPGVRDVVQIPTGVAVIADNFWAAKQGRDQLFIQWESGENDTFSSKSMFESFRDLAQTTGKPAEQKGNAISGLEKAQRKIEAVYEFPFLAHAPMEPQNCAVKIDGDKCTIWTGTQLPTLDQAAAAKILNLKPEQVEIITPFLGGGFGRRGNFNSDWIVEAVHIAKLSGKTIKLVWTREDDISGAYYRPAFLHHVTIGISAEGLPIAWQHRTVGQDVFEDFPPAHQSPIDDTAVDGIKGSPYLASVKDVSIEVHTTKSYLPVMPWRSVGKTHTCFVMETLIDELATSAGKDPLEYRRLLLKDNPRFLNSMKLAAEKANWSQPLPKGMFRGMAVTEANGSFVTQIVEMSIKNKKIHLRRVVCAIDCGLAVNPDGVIAQMEGGIIFGLTAALYGEISIDKGVVNQSNFHDYKMLRINETPRIEVYIVPGNEKMGGAGEPGVPPIAPALCNAIFAATGKRIRRLPIRKEDFT